MKEKKLPEGILDLKNMGLTTDSEIIGFMPDGSSYTYKASVSLRRRGKLINITAVGDQNKKGATSEAWCL